MLTAAYDVRIKLIKLRIIVQKTYCIDRLNMIQYLVSSLFQVNGGRVVIFADEFHIQRSPRSQAQNKFNQPVLRQFPRFRKHYFRYSGTRDHRYYRAFGLREVDAAAFVQQNE